ncbi:MAG: M23 family metallopeptidase, partial [Planctomycetaceae bacterium]|nr:M23 family metallopeptidase [Planctomycetaceae bacterium]
FDSLGIPTSGLIRSNVRNWPTSHQHDFDILPNGNVVVASYFIEETVQKTYRLSVDVEVLAPDGSVVIEAFKANGRDLGSLDSVDNPDVVALSDGGFVVLWMDRQSRDLKARRFDDAGDQVGTEFRVNITEWVYGPEDINAIELDDGRLAISWRQYSGQYDTVAHILNLDYRKPIGVGGETTDRGDDGYYAAGGGFLYHDPGFEVAPGILRDYHVGEDWNGDLPNGNDDAGDAIYAIANGTAIEQGHRIGYGETIVLDHGAQYSGGLKLYSLYAHLSAYEDQQKSEFQVGEKIGELGGTGGSWAPHLHFELFEAKSLSDGLSVGGGWATEAEVLGAENTTFDDQGRPRQFL